MPPPFGLPVQPGAESYNLFDCRDLNGDGRTDIAIYSYRTGGQPVMLMTRADGTVVKLDESLLARFPDVYGSGSTSKFVDINGDGLPDLAMWGSAGNGWTQLASPGGSADAHLPRPQATAVAPRTPPRCPSPRARACRPCGSVRRSPWSR
jgi:hypothetical protein